MTYSTQAFSSEQIDLERSRQEVVGNGLLQQFNTVTNTSDMQSSHQTESVATKTDSLVSPARYEAILRHIVTRTLSLLDAEHCSIALIDKKTGELVTRASSRVFNTENFRQSRFRLHQGVAGHVAATGQAFLCGNVQRTAQYMRIGDDQFTSIMCAPLVHKKQVLGTITVTSPRLDAFNPDHLQLLQEIAEQEAVAIAQINHSDASQRQTDKLASLLQLNQVISSIAHRETLITRVLDWLGENFAGSDAALVLFGNKASENSFHGSPFAAPILLRKEGVITNLNGASVCEMGDCFLLPPDYQESLSLQGFQCIAYAPVYRQKPDDVIGVVTLFLRQSAEAFAAGEIEVLEEVGHKLSEGLEISERLRHSQEARFHLSQLTQGANDPVVELDLEGRVCEWNEASEILFGYSAEEIMGRKLPGKDLGESDEELFEHVRQGATLANVLMEKLNKDGTELALSVTLSPVVDLEGRVTRISLLVKDITENTRLRQESVRRNQEMSNLSEIALRLASTLDNSNLLSIIKDHLNRLVDFDALFVATYNEVRNVFEIELHNERGIYYAPEIWPSDEPVMAWLLQHGRQLAIDASDNDLPLDRFQSLDGSLPTSLLVTPTKLDDQVSGFIAIANYDGQLLKQYHKQILLIVASQAAIALEKARILKRSQQKATHLTILRQVARATSSSLDLSEVLRNTVVELHRYTHFDWADVQVFGSDGVRHQLSRNQQDAHSLDMQPVPLDRTMESFAESLPHAVLVTELDRNNPEQRQVLESYRDNHLQTGVVVPFRYGERCIGLLQIGSQEDYFYSEDDLVLINDVAAQVVGAMENAQLHELVKRQVIQLEHQTKRERRLLQETAQERERLEAIFGTSSDGIILIDEQFTVLRLNSAMASFVGASSTAVGHKCTEVLRCQDKEGNLLCDIACPLQKVLQQKEPLQHHEIKLDNNQGQRRTASGNWSVVPGASGGNNVVATMRDVTALREVEQLKANFISTVSHELRNPINVINGFTKMLAEGKAGELNPLQQEFISSVLVSVNQLKKLAEDILDLSRVDAGRFSIRPNPIPLKDLVLNVTSNIKPMIYAKNIRLITGQLPESACMVNADEMRLAQCLGNLFENAIKFTPQGGRIVVELKVEGDNARVSVADSGIGIAPEHLSHIFERFYQVQDEETRRARGAQLGSGLGLSICKEIIERHDGRIWVESTRGKGTTFSFVLPLLKEA